MTIPAPRSCATCVFWSPRGERGGQASGRCRGYLQGLLAGHDPRQPTWTQADFVCGQWCERTHPIQAAE
ncbi:MAG: hypothetical protein NVV74_25985 [Magnetospirillum sp.]|nr:hypothetical protein [Magnetospirillum sp.]